MEGVQPAVLGALLAGGLLAAPIAACVVRRVAPRPLGAAVGGLIILTNSRTVLDVLDASGSVRLGMVALVVCLWGAAVAYTVRQSRRDPTVDVLVPEPVPASVHG